MCNGLGRKTLCDTIAAHTIREVLFPNMKKSVLLLNLAAGIALALVPFVLFPVCGALKPDGTPMGCHYSGIFITCAGVFVALLLLINKFTALYSVCSIVAASLCWLVPNKVIVVGLCGLCANPEHACRAATMPVVSIVAAVIVIASTALLVMRLVTGRS